MYNVNILGHSTQPCRIKVQLNGKLHEFEVDSGAALTIVNCSVFENNWPNVRERPELAPCNASLALWGGKRVHVYGQVSVQVKFKGKSCLKKLVVADSVGQSLLGRKWFGDLEISVQGIHGIDVDESRDITIQTYKPLFKEKGCTPLKYNQCILLKDNAKPKFQKARLVAILLQNKTNISGWATLAAPVLKRDGSIRICADYSKTVKACVKPNAYPLPIVKELLVTLSGGKIFSHLDVKQAYFQLPVDDATAEIFTLSTSRQSTLRYTLSGPR
ncbi:hypothetical protein PR048_003843 [Dryococelus australis]|uniref:Peptidase A2 domain-containing protein n=1 Tax=Dryococelus australis TaxID=614101 RepID=A0ABQ9IP77_9NEOP|nr:hypothetical protein PR048_003843 [Dryococelus australis]